MLDVLFFDSASSNTPNVTAIWNFRNYWNPLLLRLVLIDTLFNQQIYGSLESQKQSLSHGARTSIFLRCVVFL